MEMEMEKEQEIIAEVRERYPNAKFPHVYTSPVYWGRNGREKINNRWAVIGVVDEEYIPYDVVSEEYLLLPHEIALYHFEEKLAQLDGFGKPKIMLEFYNRGARFRARADFPKAKFTIEEGRVEKGKSVSPRADLWNSNDRSKLFRLEFGANELVCSNGLVAYKVKQAISQKHRQSLNVESTMETLVEGMQGFANQVGTWKDWARMNFEKAEAETLFEALPFGERHREKILALPQVGTGETLESWMNKGKINVWNMHSIITQFLTHEIKSEMVRVEKNSKVAEKFHRHMEKRAA
jgi:hypothetical protein